MSDAVQENTVNLQSNKNKRKQPKAKRKTTTDDRKPKKAFKRLRTEEEVHILMVGLKNAGKATITGKLRFLETSYIDMEFKALTYKNICIYVWDVGEDKGPRESHLILGTKGLIFVVDTADRDRVAEARNELNKMLKMDLLKDAVLLVFANKQDQPNAMNKDEIANFLGLSSLHRKVHSCVVMTCATSGKGLYEGLDWLSKKIGDICAISEEGCKKSMAWIRERRDEKAYKDDLDPGYVFQPTQRDLIKILDRLIDGKIITPDRVNRVNIFTDHPALIIRNLRSKLHSYEHDSQRHYLFYCEVPNEVKCSRFGYDDFSDEAKDGVWELTKATRIINCNLSDGRSLRGETQTFHYKPTKEATGSWRMDMYGLADFPHPKPRMVICKVCRGEVSTISNDDREIDVKKKKVVKASHVKSRRKDVLELLATRTSEGTMYYKDSSLDLAREAHELEGMIKRRDRDEQIEVDKVIRRREKRRRAERLARAYHEERMSHRRKGLIF